MVARKESGRSGSAVWSVWDTPSTCMTVDVVMEIPLAPSIRTSPFLPPAPSALMLIGGIGGRQPITITATLVAPWSGMRSFAPSGVLDARTLLNNTDTGLGALGLGLGGEVHDAGFTRHLAMPMQSAGSSMHAKHNSGANRHTQMIGWSRQDGR